MTVAVRPGTRRAAGVARDVVRRLAAGDQGGGSEKADVGAARGGSWLPAAACVHICRGGGTHWEQDRSWRKAGWTLNRSWRWTLAALCALAAGSAGCAEAGGEEETLQAALTALAQEPSLAFQGSVTVQADGGLALPPFAFAGAARSGAAVTLRPSSPMTAASGGRVSAAAAEAGRAAPEAGGAGAASGGAGEPSPEAAALALRDPLRQLEALTAQPPAAVRWSPALARGGQRVLEAEAAPAELRRRLTRLYREQGQALAAELGKRQAAAADTAEAAAWAALAARSAAQLEEMLAALDAQATYRFWVNAGGALPGQLEVTTAVSYRLGGAEHRETSVATYQFRPADGAGQAAGSTS